MLGMLIFPKLREGGPMGVGLRGVRWGVSEFVLQVALYKALGVSFLLPCLIYF